LIRDAAGRFYGTTYYDGTSNLGTVYQLSPTPAGEWRERVLHSFEGGLDGAHPVAHLNLDASGSLYGTTSDGGDPDCSCGTIFKLTSVGNGSWQESAVYRFTGTPDGAHPYNGMVAGPAGTFYGSTVLGGSDDDGVIFKLTP
jgi:uncharacterized repeat protein (TIGR03803 family)